MIIINLNHYLEPKFSGFETHPAILAAIEYLTVSELLVKDSDAQKLWENGDPENKYNLVKTIARCCPELVGETLVWGSSKLLIA